MNSFNYSDWEPVGLFRPTKVWIGESRITLYGGSKKLVDIDKYNFVEIKKGYLNGDYCRVGLFFTNDDTNNAVRLNRRKDMINICNACAVRQLSVLAGSYPVEKINDSALAIIIQ